MRFEPTLPESKTSIAAGGPHFVLVVDDEPFFAEVAMEMLLHAGYLATLALDSRAALRELEARPKIDLLFTDVVMPGLDGFALAQRAIAMRPGIRVLYSSCHIGLARDLSAAGDAGQSIVEKPYRQDLLLAAVKKALGVGN